MNIKDRIAWRERKEVDSLTLMRTGKAQSILMQT